ncbi:MAG: VUT family protein [Alphaproteobacteria bacterium]|nr:VUT family protein [Alphaproteobacteria bacterium]
MPYSSVDVAERPRKRKATPIQYVRVAGRLVLPVIALFLSLAVAFLLHDIPVSDSALPILSWFDHLPKDAQLAWDPRWWPLTWAHLLLPLSFFVIHLTNRAYGPEYALGQVLVTWTLIATAALWILEALGPAFTGSPIPPRQTTLAFLSGIVFGELVAIFIFDRTRGTRWWTAPLNGSLFGALFYTLIFYGLSLGLIGEPWLPRVCLDFALNAVGALALLAPYYLMRPLIKPLPGFGGK